MHQTLDLIGGLQQQAALILENPGQMTDLTGERNLLIDTGFRLDACREAMERQLRELGVDTAVEIGPGRALSGFVKKTAKDIKCYPVETAQELEAAIAALKGE